MPKNIYVLSDLHGHYNIFIKMLEKINFSDDDVLYILGDCCDRGPDSLKIYLYIQKFDNIHLIKGNHEIMMRDAFKVDDPASSQGRMWAQNGGNKTFHSYHEYLHKKAFNDCDYKVIKAAFYKMMIDYIDRCPSFIELNCNGQDYVLILKRGYMNKLKKNVHGCASISLCQKVWIIRLLFLVIRQLVIFIRQVAVLMFGMIRFLKIRSGLMAV